MRFHTFLLKYGEIGIKGKNRYLFEDALVRQVKRALTDVDGEFKVYKSRPGSMWTAWENTTMRRRWST